MAFSASVRFFWVELTLISLQVVDQVNGSLDFWDLLLGSGLEFGELSLCKLELATWSQNFNFGVLEFPEKSKKVKISGSNFSSNQLENYL